MAAVWLILPGFVLYTVYNVCVMDKRQTMMTSVVGGLSRLNVMIYQQRKVSLLNINLLLEMCNRTYMCIWFACCIHADLLLYSAPLLTLYCRKNEFLQYLDRKSSQVCDQA